MTDAVAVAAITTLGALIVGYWQFAYRPQKHRLNQVLEQVANTHELNMRDDLDEKFAALTKRNDERFDSLEHRIDDKFAGVHRRVDNVERRIDNLADRPR